MLAYPRSAAATSPEREARPGRAPEQGTEAHAVTPASTSLVPYLLGGAGFAAIGTSFLLGQRPRRDDSSLLERCAPHCRLPQVERAHGKLGLADLTLGGGVLMLGAATWLFFSGGAGEQAPSEASYRVDVKRTRSGAFATLRGAF